MRHLLVISGSLVECCFTSTEIVGLLGTAVGRVPGIGVYPSFPDSDVQEWLGNRLTFSLFTKFNDRESVVKMVISIHT